MKKIYLISAAALFLSYGVKAQQESIHLQSDIANPSIVEISSTSTAYEKAATAVINDTLDYFFNKHYYRNNAPTNLQFSTLKSPYPSSSLNIEHCGAVFLNSTNLTVTGLKGLVIKDVGSVSSSVPVKLYLCYVGLTQLPIMPPLDSVVTSVSSTTAGVWAGGTFSAPVTVTNNFAVLFKCGSTVAGDTVRLFINNAFTSTATAVPANQRYGEGFGLIRFNGNFQKTTGAFGGAAGNDYEFVVGPYVSFNMTAAGAALSSTICNYSNGSFTNQSTPMSLIENRQFNFNKFKPYWAPTNTLMPTTDSIYNWTFTGSSTPPTTNKNPTAFFNTLGTQSGNLTVKYRRSHGSMGPALFDATSIPIDVNNGTAPVISVSGATAFCTTSSAVTATLFCSGSTSYTWSAPVNSVSPFVSITQTANIMVYTVTAQSAGCASVKEVTIIINPPPTVSITANKPTVCTKSTGGAGVTLTGQPTGGVFSGTNVSGSTFNPISAGTFSISYSYTNSVTSCSNSISTTVKVTDCTALNQQASNEKTISAFPNPSQNGIITLKNMDGVNDLEVINILGQPVLKLQSNKSEVEIDLSGQTKGNYFIKITNSNGELKILKIVNQN